MVCGLIVFLLGYIPTFLSHTLCPLEILDEVLFYFPHIGMVLQSIFRRCSASITSLSIDWSGVVAEIFASFTMGGWSYAFLCVPSWGSGSVLCSKCHVSELLQHPIEPWVHCKIQVFFETICFIGSLPFEQKGLTYLQRLASVLSLHIPWLQMSVQSFPFCPIGNNFLAVERSLDLRLLSLRS